MGRDTVGAWALAQLAFAGGPIVYKATGTVSLAAGHMPSPTHMHVSC